ncbi:MAG: hypothetical protein ACRYG7_04560 [Janthinobacterium lividum]
MEPANNDSSTSSNKKRTMGKGFTVGVDADAHRHVEAQAKKLSISKSQYASAAITYFAKSGLDPTKEQPKGLANVSDKVGQDTRAIRVQNVDIANRLIGIIRAWEKTLYGFMQVQQGTTLSYLEQIEKNIMSHQVAVETNLLSPLIEQVIQGSIESYMARVVGERTHLHVTAKPKTDWAEMNQNLNGERDQQLVKRLRDFITTNTVPVPKLSVKPSVPAAPAKAVATPAPGAASATTPPGTGTPPK